MDDFHYTTQSDLAIFGRDGGKGRSQVNEAVDWSGGQLSEDGEQCEVRVERVGRGKS